jgi:hypothetical protein
MICRFVQICGLAVTIKYADNQSISQKGKNGRKEKELHSQIGVAHDPGFPAWEKEI